MSVIDEFRIAVAAAEAELPDPELLPERLARACAAVLPVDGAGISLFFAPDRRLPLGASDPESVRAERLQFTLGEGPCLASYEEGRPLVADEETLRSRWPVFYDALVTETSIRGTVSLPLGEELTGIGAVDLYLIPPSDITALRLQDAMAVTDEIAAAFRDRIGGARPESEGPAWLDAPGAQRRSVVWQALGFVNSGLGVSTTDALAILRVHAFVQGQDLDELAQQVVDREVPLESLALDQDIIG